SGVSFAMPEEEYRKLAERLSTNPKFVPMKHKPAGLSASARFGINLSFGGLNRSWVLDGDDQQGYVLFADLNGNGDLSDDTPLRFTKDDGRYSVVLRQTVTEKIDGRDESYPVELRLDAGEVTKADHSDPRLALTISSETLRRGVIRVGGRDVVFALAGSSGVYNWDYNRVYFDLVCRLLLDKTNRKSAESFVVSDKYVNLA